ncbi:MAG: pyridoxal 5'-phosphate synthase glutaminase subunit PdxT [Actinomycetota bacterium]|nr:pyridoxal 5'-phosphate synthase glutaminase subunit PdxT [Actinomycetota bacterium]
MSVKAGVLALQGDFKEHLDIFRGLGVEAVEVRLPAQLDGVTHLVIPGGESTAISMLLESSGLDQTLRQYIADGRPIFGTCAGMILLSKEILGGRSDQIAFGAIDITVQRNGFGRQVESFETRLEVKGITDPIDVAFIRAPVVVRIGDGVEDLANVDYVFKEGGSRRVPVVCSQGPTLVSSFHPEVTGESGLHRLFIERF